jgi:hypothetical protein
MFGCIDLYQLEQTDRRTVRVDKPAKLTEVFTPPIAAPRVTLRIVDSHPIGP